MSTALYFIGYIAAGIIVATLARALVFRDDDCDDPPSSPTHPGPVRWSLEPTDLPGWSRSWAAEPDPADPVHPSRYPTDLPPPRHRVAGFVWSSMVAEMAANPEGERLEPLGIVLRPIEPRPRGEAA